MSIAATLRLHRTGTLRLTLSEAATVTLRFQRLLAGRRKAGRCVAPRRAPHGRRCTRIGKPLSQHLGAAAGVDRLRIGDRVGTHVLAVGSYRLTIVATDAAGNVSAPLTRRLRVVKPARRR